MEEKLKGQFVTGNYKAVIDSNSASKGLLPAFMHFSSLVEIGQKSALDSAPSSLPLSNLQLLYSHVNQGESIKEKITPDSFKFNETLQIISQINEGELTQVIESTKPESSEKISLVACALVKLRHPEIAEIALKNALSRDDEDPSLQFAMAISLIAKGEYEESSAILNELSQKFGDSPLLLNSLAICALQEGNYPEAEQNLNRAMTLSNEINGKNLDISLKNMIALKRQTGEDYSLYEQQLAKLYPNDPYFQIMHNASELLDQLISA